MDRQTSILTNAQREFLAEGGEGANARMTRKRIRERVHAGLFDFPLLSAGLESRDRRAIFENQSGDSDTVYNVLPSALAFLYLGVTDTVDQPDLAQERFETMVAQGVRRAYEQRGVSIADVDVSIDVTQANVDKPIEDMSLREIEILARSGELSREELTDRLAERRMEKKREEGSRSAENGPSEKYVEWLEDMLFPPEDDIEREDDPLDTDGPYDPTDEFE